MRRMFVLAASVALLGLLAAVDVSRSQDKKEAWGILKGKVTLAADAAIPAPLNLAPKMAAHADKACCLAGKEIEKTDNTWIVDKDTRGVANVLVYLKAQPKQELPIADADKKRTDTVVLNQPHCQFVPHMVAIFPSYGPDKTPTGQKFELKNEAPVPHNTRGTGNPKYDNLGFNFTLPPGTDKVVELNPQPLPVMINCDIHPWMKAWVGVYDHPYFAITKEDGSYTIPRVPAGIQVTLMAWHEGVGYVLTNKGRPVTFKTGDNTEDMTVTPR